MYYRLFNYKHFFIYHLYIIFVLYGSELTGITILIFKRMTEIEQLKHRLEMIKDEHNVLQKMINDNPLISIPISVLKTPYNHNVIECFNNIGIACDLDDTASLTWKPYIDKFEGYIQPKDVIKDVKIKNWFCHLDNMSGVIEWTNPKYPHVSILATPNWKNDGKVPVNVLTNDITEFILILYLTKNNYDIQIERYKQTIEFAIKSHGYE